MGKTLAWIFSGSGMGRSGEQSSALPRKEESFAFVHMLLCECVLLLKFQIKK